jgi:molecular chaperone GrpE
MNKENLTDASADQTLNPEVIDNENLSQADARILELEGKVQELEDQIRRSMADYQNLLRRSQQEREQARLYAAEPALTAIIPTLDNFYLALRSFNEESSSKVLLDSLNMIWSNLLSSLNQLGFKLLENSGDQFNPLTQEAVAQVPQEDKEEGLVLEVFRPGYSLNDKVLRPAQVSVCKR